MPPRPPRPRLPPEALAQGYNDTLYLHGTVGDVRRFAPARRGSAGGGPDSKGATYLVEADEPGVQVANSYAGMHASRLEQEMIHARKRIESYDRAGQSVPRDLQREYERLHGAWEKELEEIQADRGRRGGREPFRPGANIIPAVTRANPLVLRPTQSLTRLHSDDLTPQVAEAMLERGEHPGYYHPNFYAAAQKRAAELGHDAVRFEQVIDGGGVPSNVLAVLDDSTIRSPNARFDPARRDSNDLLAFDGGAGGAPGSRQVAERMAGSALRRAANPTASPEDALGSVDALGSLASMLAGSAYGGYRGLSTMLGGLMSGESLAEASRIGAEQVGESTEAASWEPLTESGNEQLAGLGGAMEQLSAPATAAGQWAGEEALNLPAWAGGGPAAATAVDLFAQLALDPTNFLGGSGAGGGAVRNITKKQLQKALERATGPADVRLPEVKRPPFESSPELQREINMLAGSNPGGQPLPWDENRARTQQMGERLIESYGPDNVHLARGVYGGEPELSFMVTPPEERASVLPELQDLADEFGQDSVFNNRYGLAYGGERRGQTTPLANRNPTFEGERWTRETLPENWADVEDGPVPGDTIGPFEDFYSEINTPQGPTRFQYGLDFERTGKLPEFDPRTVDATHWSPRGDLTEIDPAFYGTAAAGKEKGRVAGGDDRRVFGYARGPNGEEAAPEDVVASGAPNRYFAQFGDIYDAARDPQGLAAASFNVSDLEQLAREQGYKGVLSPEPGEYGTVVGFDRVPVSREDPLAAAPKPSGGGGAPRGTRYRALTGDPQYPGIYKPVNQLLEEARAINAPESDALRQVFGVGREDLDQGMRQFSERLSSVYPEFAPTRNKHPRGSASAEALDRPQNWQRLRDATEAGLQMPGVRGWYNTEPLFEAYLRNWGPEEGPKKFARDMGIQAVASANTPVPMQAKRGMLAQYLLKQGVESPFRSPEFGKGSGFGTTTNPLQAGLLDTLLDEGRVRPESPGAYKIPTYYGNFLGHTDSMTLDAHQARNTGLADMRSKLAPETKDVAKNPAGAEYAVLEQLLKENVSNPLGILAAEAQPAQWVVYSPQTGVKSLGGPFLEEYARIIQRTAQRTGEEPRSVLDRIIMGDMRPFP